MAKKSRSRRSRQRDVITSIATGQIRRPVLPKIIVPLRTLSDDRQFRPVFFKRVPIPRDLLARRAVVKPRAVFKSRMPAVVFNLPRQAVVCVRRRMRKQVLFAKGFGGRSGRRRPPRRNMNSNYRC